MSKNVLFVGVLNIPQSGNGIAELIKAHMLQTLGLTSVEYANASDGEQCGDIWARAELVATNRELVPNVQARTCLVESIFPELVAKNNAELRAEFEAKLESYKFENATRVNELTYRIQNLSEEVAKLKQDGISWIPLVASPEKAQQPQQIEAVSVIETLLNEPVLEPKSEPPVAPKSSDDFGKDETAPQAHVETTEVSKSATEFLDVPKSLCVFGEDETAKTVPSEPKSPHDHSAVEAESQASPIVAKSLRDLATRADFASSMVEPPKEDEPQKPSLGSWADAVSDNETPDTRSVVISSASKSIREDSEPTIRKQTGSWNDVSARRHKPNQRFPNHSSHHQRPKHALLEPIRRSKGPFGVTNMCGDWTLIMASESLEKHNNECTLNLKMAKIRKESKDKGLHLSDEEFENKLQSTHVLPTVCVANLCNRCNQRSCYYIHGIMSVNHDKIPKETLKMIPDDLYDHLHELKYVPVGCVAIRINDEWAFSQKKRNRYWFTFELKDKKFVLSRWYDLELDGLIDGYPEGVDDPALDFKQVRVIVCRYRSSKKELDYRYIVTNHLLQVPKGSDEAY